MENEVALYPLDFDALSKGDVIPAEKIEMITSEKRGTNEYRFKALRLSGRIQDEMRDRGTPVTISFKGDDIVILTDQEASVHNAMLFGQWLRRLAGTHRRSCEVNVANLGPEQRIDHDRKLYEQGFFLQALSKARKELKVEGHQRTTPGLLS